MTKNTEEFYRPRSCYELVGIANYILASGKIDLANNAMFESYARDLKNDGGYIDCYILEDGTFVAGEIPETLKDKKVVVEAKYQTHIKYNIAINGFAKTLYKLTTDESRAYKITLAEFFLITEGDYETFKEKCEGPFGTAKHPLPNPSQFDDIEIKDVYRWDINVDVSVKPKKTKAAGQDMSDSAKRLVKKVTAHEKKRQNRVELKTADKIEMAGELQHEFDITGITERIYKTADKIALYKTEDIGEGLFPLVLQCGANIRYHILVKNRPLEKVLNVFAKEDIPEKHFKKFVPIILNYEFSGETIQNAKIKADDCVIWDKGTYKVYR